MHKLTSDNKKMSCSLERQLFIIKIKKGILTFFIFGVEMFKRNKLEL